MTVFDYIYQFYIYLFSSQDVSTTIFEDLEYEFGINNLSLNIYQWLAFTLTCITIILISYFFIRLAIWFFKLGANLFKW